MLARYYSLYSFFLIFSLEKNIQVLRQSQHKLPMYQMERLIDISRHLSPVDNKPSC